MHTAKILKIDQVTHDVKRFRISEPEGFDFNVGDATEIALDQDGWREETRPFTMTSLPEEKSLEFTIKGYPEHDGVTKRLHALKEGDTVLIADPFKTFRYEEPGVFIAGGAGITPFLAIFRMLEKEGKLAGNHLIIANKTSEDIIYKSQLESMDGLKVDHVLSDEDLAGTHHGLIDADLLTDLVPDLDRRFYLCGPPPMMEAVEEVLGKLGVKAEAIAFSD
ncbi:FAD-binding oxidoreductase [Roseibium sediminicola]|uniref:FAD-binding oxidoreductase n=1 Tax=Roseibium sediminicola TaxID=2933272 RepID=A0ABT0H187_9HYPH|nr:FAD-binding oxidoreductase [Roseibium sp. CAU 1639]MCK7615434.1 FAD-binding oxidoreductase [Roseibium sp. CAU 1639]